MLFAAFWFTMTNPFLREKLRALFGLSDQERAALGEHAPRLAADMKRLVRFASPEIGREAVRLSDREPSYDRFAREACRQARRLVDAYIGGERDENDRRPRKPSKNAVALLTYRAVVPSAAKKPETSIRSAANKLYDAAMTPERLVGLGLSNPLDELSAHTKRTRTR